MISVTLTGPEQSPIRCADKPGNNRARCCDYPVRFIRPHHQKKRHNRRSVYDRGCGRRYRDRRERLIRRRNRGLSCQVKLVAYRIFDAESSRDADESSEQSGA